MPRVVATRNNHRPNTYQPSLVTGQPGEAWSILAEMFGAEMPQDDGVKGVADSQSLQACSKGPPFGSAGVAAVPSLNRTVFGSFLFGMGRRKEATGLGGGPASARDLRKEGCDRAARRLNSAQWDTR